MEEGEEGDEDDTWEEEEHLGKLAAAEEIGEVLHGVGAEAGHVGVAARVLGAQGGHAVPHVVGHLEEGSL
jgi:hypothetical protein